VGLIEALVTVRSLEDPESETSGLRMRPGTRERPGDCRLVSLKDVAHRAYAVRNMYHVREDDPYN